MINGLGIYIYAEVQATLKAHLRLVIRNLK